MGWLRAGEFQASWFTNGWRDSGSAPEGGEYRAVPARWAGASGSRSCLSELRGWARRRGAGAPGSGCPQPQVQRLGGRSGLCANPPTRRGGGASRRQGGSKEIQEFGAERSGVRARLPAKCNCEVMWKSEPGASPDGSHWAARRGRSATWKFV